MERSNKSREAVAQEQRIGGGGVLWPVLGASEGFVRQRWLCVLAVGMGTTGTMGRMGAVRRLVRWREIVGCERSVKRYLVSGLATARNAQVRKVPHHTQCTTHRHSPHSATHSTTQSTTHSTLCRKYEGCGEARIKKLTFSAFSLPQQAQRTSLLKQFLRPRT